jgi:alpha-N-acetylglucosamine transferase
MAPSKFPFQVPLALQRRHCLILIATVGVSCATLLFYLSTRELLPESINVPYVTIPHVSEILPTFGDNSTRQTSQKYAFATFLSTRIDDATAYDEDIYFTATRVLTYQLLYRPETRTRRDIPFLIIVPPHVSKAKRDILSSEGATIIEVPLLNPDNWTASPAEPRWIDQFTKLRLFEQTQYDRILYMDTDMLLTKPLDSIFSEDVVATPQWTANDKQAMHEREASLPETYIIAGTTDNGRPGNFHPAIRTEETQMNGGFWCMQPSTTLFNYYVTLLNYGDFESSNMEMGLLNYAHRDGGPMPWISLPPGKWSNNWPVLRDVEVLGSATLHDKFWEEGNKDWIDRELVEMWWRVQGQMEGYWLMHNKVHKLKRRSIFDTGG